MFRHHCSLRLRRWLKPRKLHIFSILARRMYTCLWILGQVAAVVGTTRMRIISRDLVQLIHLQTNIVLAKFRAHVHTTIHLLIYHCSNSTSYTHSYMETFHINKRRKDKGRNINKSKRYEARGARPIPAHGLEPNKALVYVDTLLQEWGAY